MDNGTIKKYNPYSYGDRKTKKGYCSWKAGMKTCTRHSQKSLHQEQVKEVLSMAQLQMKLFCTTLLV